MLERAFAADNGSKLEALYGGDVGGYDSPSEADLALCSMLAFWTGPDPDQLDRLFRGSGLMREKWDSARGASTYGRQTVEKTIAEKREFYDWNSAPPRPRGETPGPGGDQQEEWPPLPGRARRRHSRSTRCHRTWALGSRRPPKRRRRRSTWPPAHALGVLSAATMGETQVKVKDGWLEELALWPICALPSGERKSIVVHAATAPFREYERKIDQDAARRSPSSRRARRSTSSATAG